MQPTVITFDCYGTLVQWDETLRAYFRSILPVGADAEDFRRAFIAAHTPLRNGPYQPYNKVLRQSLADALERYGLPPDPTKGDDLIAAIRDVPPFPDVQPTLTRLAERYRLAIISNTEDTLIASTVRGLGVPITVITAEQARAFKPDHRLFHHAFARLGCQPAEVVHVGAGYATDMVSGYELGLRRIWINRAGEVVDATTPPTLQLHDLRDLAVRLVAMGAEATAPRPVG